jgi:hypothetical protein
MPSGHPGIYTTLTDVTARIELPPEIRTLTQATICRLLIFDKKEIRDVETEAARA